MGDRRIEVFDNLNNMIRKYGRPYIPLEELPSLGVQHIFIRGGGYVKFSLVVSRRELFNIINKRFADVVEEHVEGYKGIYGYLGVNPEFLNNVKESKALITGEKMFIVSADYMGSYYIINSGSYGGMALITEDLQNISIKSAKS